MSGSLSPLAGIPLLEAANMRRDLIRAMASGSLSVRYSDGSSVTYRTMAEMKTALTEIEGRISAAAVSVGDTSAAPIRAIRLTPSSGWR